MSMDEKYFRAIYDSYFEDICRFLNYYSHDLFLIEEIVQDVFVNLWRDRDTKDIQYIKTYLLRSAHNKMVNALRDRNNRDSLLNKWVQQQFEDQQGQDCVDIDDFLIQLQKALNDLPARCREVFALGYLGKLSYKEIAETQKISIKTVDNQMQLAMKKIREYFQSH
ncbi:DNA-directed RNA polymerase sigma-70 factor [Bacteroidia bacterium]|nr:DNA-directed RNA polymerase sigma-70 factor [Bacteroidia bacterium]GHU55287.1 DNA-directed RNA polymerase sigma-70 factor [Bacteroidia bacterium]